MDTTMPDTLQLLVVDDDDVDRERVVRFVDHSNLKIQTTQAASGKEAIALARERVFDCVVLDNHLPDSSGAELLPILRGDPDHLCPVIMVTGEGNEELAAEVMRAGASDYLPKSRLSTDSLLRAIARSVKTCRMQEQLRTFANALAASEAKYRAIVEDQVELISLVRPDLVFTYVNAAYASHHGLSPDDMIGRSLLDFVPGDDRDLAGEHFGRVCRDKSIGRIEYRTMAVSTNLTRWVAWTHRPLLDENGKISAIQCVGRDINDQVRGRDAVARLAAIVDCSADAVASSDLRGAITTWNAAAERLFGYSNRDAVGHSFGLIVPSHLRQEQQALARRVTDGESIVEFETVRSHSDGSPVDVAITLSPIRDGRGIIVGMSKILRDIRERKRLTRILEEEHARLRVTLRSIGDAVITTDREGRVEFMNPIAESLTGWSDGDARGKLIDQVFRVVSEETGRAVDNPVTLALTQKESVGLPNRCLLIGRGGNEFGIEDSSAPIRDAEGHILGVVLVFHDVTAQRRMTSEMNFRASHDPLTGLLNRSEFEDRLKRGLARIKESGGEMALLYIDLDQFKLVNDACGHSAGDQLLRQIGGVLQRCIRGRDTLARLGGDEFAVILEHCSAEQALGVAQQICDRIVEFRFIHDERRFRLGASIGLVPADAHWPNEAALLQAADACCYAAKEAGRNRVHAWFETDKALHAHHGETQWASRIEGALDDNRFTLFAQRIEPLNGDGAGLHFEVLVRMIDVDGSLILPGAILPAAERFHMAPRIDRWVLRAVFQWMAKNRSQLDGVGLIGVNLSGQSVGDRAFHRFVAELLGSVPVDVHKLCFEITESAAITNLHDATEFVGQMRELAACIALDDFGAGASSFGYLKSLPVDYLKIDGQFVRNIIDNPLNDVAVRCFRDVASVVGVKTVAEFVESEEIRDRLIDIGIDFGQGYAFHRPEPLDSMLRPILR